MYTRSMAFAFLGLSVMAFAHLPVLHALEPADPGLIPEARCVLEYLKSIEGKKIIAGVSRKGPFPAALQMSGRQPAMYGTDFYGWSHKYDERYHANVRAELALCRHWWQQKGGIVQIHIHWGMPTEKNGSAWTNRNPKGRIDLARTVTPGTGEYEAFHQDLSVTADYLQQLAQAGVPVLWRPFHEIDGGWFWWTDPERPENTAALWRQMFRYLVDERRIHNLIWVYNAAHRCGKAEATARQDKNFSFEDEIAYRKRFYPGGKYVDIASIDTYGNPRLGWGAPQQDARRKAYELMQGIAPDKPLAIGEDSGMLNPDIAQKEGPPWLYTMAWWMHDRDWTSYALNHEHMITLDRLPLLSDGNVAPNVRIVAPADGQAVEPDRVELTGFASDRNGNLAGVALYAVGDSWFDWRERGEETVRKELEAAGKRLGEAAVDAQGRWTFLWNNVPPGYHQLIAVATDDEGSSAHSNVVRVTAGIKDLALAKPVLASSRDRWGGPAESAVDGNLWTAWWADRKQPDPQWLQVDLGTVRTVGAVGVLWWKAYAKNYAVQVSEDGKTWREAARVKGRRVLSGDSDVIRFEPVQARYVRLHCTEPAVTWMTYAVHHFGVYERLPGGH